MTISHGADTVESATPSAGTVYIENLGCAKNQVDAEIMGNRLEEAGWRWIDNPESADLIIVNTCGFIESAQQESIDVTLDLAARFPDTSIALAGCLAQRYADDIRSGMRELAGVFGNRDPQRITEFVDLLAKAPASKENAEPVVWLPPGEETLRGDMRRRRLSHPRSTYLKVAEGCDHGCSFCAIPTIRGALRLRERADIMREFRSLRRDNVFEFNLVAQDLAAWRDAERTGEGITALLDAMLAEPGQFWIRLLYLYPDTFPEELLQHVASDSRLVPYFDLSFQHAASSILRRMGRPGTAEAYLSLIERIRIAVPDVALRSSFIVGFPGETEAEFEELLAFIRAARLEWVGVFTFSPQEDTRAATMSVPFVPAEEGELRRERLMAEQESIMTERLERFVGRTLPVLVEEPIPNGGVALARSPQQAPEVDGLVVVRGGGDLEPGDVAEVTITGVSGADLLGRVARS